MSMYALCSDIYICITTVDSTNNEVGFNKISEIANKPKVAIFPYINVLIYNREKLNRILMTVDLAN